MMDVYLLSLYVTLEQEIAIRELFVCKGWTFNKGDEQKAVTETIDEQNFEPRQFCDRRDISKFAANQIGSTSIDQDQGMVGTDVFTNIDQDQGMVGTDVFTSIDQDQGMVGTDVFSDLQEYVTAALDSERSVVAAEEHVLEDYGEHSKSSNYGKDGNMTIQESLSSETEVDEVSIITKNNNDVNKKNITQTEMLEDTILSSQTALQPCSDGEEEELKCKQTCINSFKCIDCERSFKRLSALEKHKKNGKCVFVCEFCNKKYTSQTYSHYVLHLKYHKKDKNHKCSECGKCFVEAHNLRKHMLRHNGKKMFQCEVCGSKFYELAQLNQHKHSFHKESNIVHKCDKCEAILSTAGNLKFHKEVVHSRERPWTCEICGKNFKTQKTLEKVHAKVHQDVYPFKCEFPGCDKSFKRSEGFLEHTRRHRNERTHFCDQCGKGFYNSKDLLLHTRIHTGVKPFACTLCPYKSTLAGNLRKHLKIHK